MGAIAVLHVFISHFAVGGGLYLVTVETIARRRTPEDRDTLDFLRKLSRFFVMTTLVFGALTGVGIWFIIGLINPAATELLIHHFVWAWAIEWSFFVIEIVAAILYTYGWERLPAKNHLILGWIYFVSAFMSLVVINGIITFMLTPGEWLRTGNFWDGYFNPSYWPSLFFRTGISLTLAGLYAFMLLTRRAASDLKARAIRHTTAWGFLGLAICVPSFLWYWRAIPEAMRKVLLEQMPTPMRMYSLTYVFAAVLALIFLVFGVIFAKRAPFVIGLVAMVVGFASFGSFEWFRESARKPYVIQGAMYGNAVPVAALTSLQKHGMLSAMPFRSGDMGADLFRHACRSCHTLDGFKALKPALAGLDEAFVTGLIQNSESIRGNMPPFAGTQAEAQILAIYLLRRFDEPPFASKFTDEALGAEVWRRRCAQCHLQGGFRDVQETLDSFEPEELKDTLDSLQDLADGMPPFSGDQRERDALVAYLISLRSQGVSP